MNKDELVKKMNNFEIKFNKFKISVNKQLKELDNETVFVPKEIGLTTFEDGTMALQNGNGQWLMIDSNGKYSVDASDIGYSDNTGSNYKLVKVDKLEVGKLYFVTDNINNNYISELTGYRFILDNESNKLFWIENNNYWSVVINCIDWKDYYEVVKVE